MSGRVRADFERLVLLETDKCIIWSHAAGRDGYGYVRVGRRGAVAVHSLALERRVGPRPNGSWAAHAPVICHNRLCMNYRHLRWTSPTENHADMVLDGTHQVGEQKAGARLTEAEVHAIRSASAAGIGYRRLARLHRVGSTTIARVVKRRTWRHVA